MKWTENVDWGRSVVKSSTVWCNGRIKKITTPKKDWFLKLWTWRPNTTSWGIMIKNRSRYRSCKKWKQSFILNSFRRLVIINRFLRIGEPCDMIIFASLCQQKWTGHFWTCWSFSSSCLNIQIILFYCLGACISI